VVTFEEAEHQEEPVQPELESGACKVYEGASAAVRLAQMGLRESYFHDAALYGHERRERCLPVHPKSYKGQVMWAETIGEIRTQLLDRNDDWRIGRKGNYDTVYNISRQIAIAVVGGDPNTGERTFEHPMTARPRGPVTEQRVMRNRRGQLAIPFKGLPSGEEPNEEQCATWFFLLNARSDSLFCELSLPLSMGRKQRISVWAERILFAPLRLVGAVTPFEPDETYEEAPRVHVERK
jgi:hypothetical protein